MVARVRNRGAVPFLDTEGRITKPLPKKGTNTLGTDWYKHLSVYDRLFSYQTLASTRRYAHFVPHSGLIPEDALDFCLSAVYDAQNEVFSDKVDIVLQRETMNEDTWRRLRNTRDIKPEKDAISAAAAAAAAQGQHGGSERKPLKQNAQQNKPARKPAHESKVSNGRDAREKDKFPVPHRENKYHPVFISGITERRHPSNVKLMNSSHHSPQTNAGYSRQDSDGNAYQY